MLKTKKMLQTVRAAAASALLALALWTTPSSALADDDEDQGCSSASVEGIPVPFNPEFGNDIGGRAKLCAGKHGLNGYMRVDNLTEGNAYTVWWVYTEADCEGGFFGCLWTFFGDDPEDFYEVGTPPCGDAFPACIDEPPVAAFGRMDSGVSKGRGVIRFADRLDDMRVSPGSQVWMLMFGHGPSSDDGLKRARQLLTPEDPISGYPHVGVDPDGYPAAIAIFEMP